MRTLVKSRPQPLTGELHEAKARDLAHLNARAIKMKCIAQALLYFALIFLRLHVDEVDHNQAA